MEPIIGEKSVATGISSAKRFQLGGQNASLMADRRNRELKCRKPAPMINEPAMANICLSLRCVRRAEPAFDGLAA
jgi:hypothetical protein